jgi:hypothetical protein
VFEYHVGHRIYRWTVFVVLLSLSTPITSLDDGRFSPNPFSINHSPIILTFGTNNLSYWISS